MPDTNYFILTTRRLKPDRKEQRVAILRATVKALQDYHDRARPLKRPVIMGLIVRYTDLLDKLGA